MTKLRLRTLILLLAGVCVLGASSAATAAASPICRHDGQGNTASTRADRVTGMATTAVTGGAPLALIGGPRPSPSASVVAAESEGEFVNLASDARTTHILEGDATGGGHQWPGLADKTPFPEGWSGVADHA
jgi:hypothetical protein